MNEYKRKGMVHGRIRASRRWRAFAALPLLYTKIIIKKKTSVDRPMNTDQLKQSWDCFALNKARPFHNYYNLMVELSSHG